MSQKDFNGFLILTLIFTFFAIASYNVNCLAGIVLSGFLAFAFAMCLLITAIEDTK